MPSGSAENAINALTESRDAIANVIAGRNNPSKLTIGVAPLGQPMRVLLRALLWSTVA